MCSGGDRRHPRLATEQLGEDVECSDVVLPRGGEKGADDGERACTVVTLEATADLLVNYPALGVMASKCWQSGGSFQPAHVTLKAVGDSIMAGHLAFPSALSCIASKRPEIGELSGNRREGLGGGPRPRWESAGPACRWPSQQFHAQRPMAPSPPAPDRGWLGQCGTSSAPRAYSRLKDRLARTGEVQSAPPSAPRGVRLARPFRVSVPQPCGPAHAWPWPHQPSPTVARAGSTFRPVLPSS